MEDKGGTKWGKDEGIGSEGKREEERRERREEERKYTKKTTKEKEGR